MPSQGQVRDPGSVRRGRDGVFELGEGKGGTVRAVRRRRVGDLRAMARRGENPGCLRKDSGSNWGTERADGADRDALRGAGPSGHRV